jgi:hypothetical protein
MGYEDLTKYTEVDPNSRITVTSAKATAVNLTCDEDAYVYMDFGADRINAVDFNFVMYNDDMQQGVRIGMGVTNTIGPWNDWASTDFGVFFWNLVGSQRLYLQRDSFLGAADFDVLAIDTLRYITLQRAAGSDDVYCYIYSDASRETLIDTLTISGVGTGTFQYVYAICTADDNDNDKFNGYFQNFELNLGPQPSIVRSALGLLTPSIGLYDTRFKLRARNRDTALTTRVRNT